MDRGGSAPGRPKRNRCAALAHRSRARPGPGGMAQTVERLTSTIDLDDSKPWVNWAMSRAVRGFPLAWLLLIASSAHAAGVPAECEQLIVGIAPDWNSMRGTLQRYERSGSGPWHPVSDPVPVLFGKNGLAWGRGL